MCGTTTQRCKEQWGRGEGGARHSLNAYEGRKQRLKHHGAKPDFQNKAGNDNKRHDRLGSRTVKGTITVTTIVKQTRNSRSTQIIIPSLTNKTSQSGPLPTCRIRRTQIMRFANAPVRFSPFCSRVIRELEPVRLKLSLAK